MLNRIQNHRRLAARLRFESKTFGARLRVANSHKAEVRQSAKDLLACRQQLGVQDKWTVRFGIEQGLTTPLLILTTHIHPQEFLFAMSLQANVTNVNRFASRVADELAYKIRHALVEYVSKR